MDNEREQLDDQPMAEGKGNYSAGSRVSNSKNINK
jgi:hypothetical protein